MLGVVVRVPGCDASVVVLLPACARRVLLGCCCLSRFVVGLFPFGGFRALGSGLGSIAPVIVVQSGCGAPLFWFGQDALASLWGVCGAPPRGVFACAASCCATAYVWPTASFGLAWCSCARAWPWCASACLLPAIFFRWRSCFFAGAQLWCVRLWCARAFVCAATAWQLLWSLCAGAGCGSPVFVLVPLALLVGRGAFVRLPGCGAPMFVFHPPVYLVGLGVFMLAPGCGAPALVFGSPLFWGCCGIMTFTSETNFTVTYFGNIALSDMRSDTA